MLQLVTVYAYVALYAFIVFSCLDFFSGWWTQMRYFGVNEGREGLLAPVLGDHYNTKDMNAGRTSRRRSLFIKLATLTLCDKIFHCEWAKRIYVRLKKTPKIAWDENTKWDVIVCNSNALNNSSWWVLRVCFFKFIFANSYWVSLE